jgi:hypothetical protein
MDQTRHVFKASRLTPGNRIFPVRIEITPDRVSRVKPSWFSRDEISMALPNVASVSIATGLVFASIRIDSSGGSVPIESAGHYKGDARRIRDIIQGLQKR